MKTVETTRPSSSADANDNHNDNANTSLRRLQQISRLLALACWVLMVALPPLLAWFWAFASPAQLAVRVNLPADVVQGSLMVWQRVAGGCISAVPLALLLMGVWQARQCLVLFAAGQVFTLRAVTALQRFAKLATASFACSILAAMALSVVLTLTNAPGMRHLAVGLNTDHAFALFFAGMVWLMAGVIAQGLTLADENAKFI